MGSPAKRQQHSDAWCVCSLSRPGNQLALITKHTASKSIGWSPEECGTSSSVQIFFRALESLLMLFNIYALHLVKLTSFHRGLAVHQKMC